jgi:hypothetical protein
MRLRRLLHDTTRRLELAALQKADAAADRLTVNATIIETGTESYRPAQVGPLQGVTNPPTATRRGQIKPSRWGQNKPS